jgi:hypothetical protein
MIANVARNVYALPSTSPISASDAGHWFGDWPNALISSPVLL